LVSSASRRKTWWIDLPYSEFWNKLGLKSDLGIQSIPQRTTFINSQFRERERWNIVCGNLTAERTDREAEVSFEDRVFCQQSQAGNLDGLNDSSFD